MKRVIRLLIIILSLTITTNVYALRRMNITINENGTVNTTLDGVTNPSDWYKYENDTLYLYTPITGRNSVYQDYYETITINRNTKLVISEEVHISYLNASANITFENNNTDYTFTIDRITGNDNNDLIINKTSINDSYEKVSQIRNFKNVIIKDSFISQNTDPSNAIVFNNYFPGEFTNIGEAKTGLKMENSKVKFSQVGLNGDGFTLEGSELIVANGIRTVGDMYVKDSYLQTSTLNVSGNDNYVENSEIKLYGSFSMNDFYSGSKTVLKDTTLTCSDMRGLRIEADNVKITTNAFRGGGLIAKDSNISFGNESSYMAFMYLQNSKLISKNMNDTSFNNFTLYNDSANDANYYDESFKIIDSTFEAPIDISTYNVLINNSTVKVGTLETDETSMNDNYKKFDVNIINSQVTIMNDTDIEGSLSIDHSTVHAASLQLGYPYGSNPVLGVFKIHDSKLFIETEEDVGLILDVLDFKKSNIIISAKVMAWRSKDTIERFNIIGINRNKKILDYKSKLFNYWGEPINTDSSSGSNYYDEDEDAYYFKYNGVVYKCLWSDEREGYVGDLLGPGSNTLVLSNVIKYYTFIDNGEISPYVEIKTPLRITFKVVNGTWADGTTGDKYADSYYYGELDESDVPVGMLANSGYEDGSWDKEIVYDELNDEYVYTYTFKKHGLIKGVEENPKTGVFVHTLSFLFIAVMCAVLYTRIKKNTYFNN